MNEIVVPVTYTDAVIPYETHEINVIVSNGISTSSGGGGGSGDVVGQAPSVIGNFPAYIDITGKLIGDSGYGPSSFLKQGSNVLTQDLNFDGAFPVNFGAFTPISNFGVVATDDFSLDAGNSAQFIVGASQLSMSLTGVGVANGLGASTVSSTFSSMFFNGQGLKVDGSNIGLYNAGLVSRFLVTSAGVIKLIPSAGAPTVGYVWTATNADGSGSWQAGGGGGGNPFDDATAIIKGSADATKLLRIEVDGFTTATTRVATFPNADITVASINVAQTFAPIQTFTLVPVFTAGLGSATATTQTPLTNNTTLATTAYTDLAIIAASLPSFDTINDGYVLQSGGAGRLLLGDGTWLPVSTNGFVLTLAAGVPTWAANAGMTNPMTSIGDLIQGTTAGAPVRLASVAVGSFLRSGGVTTASAWSTTVWTNSATTGDLLYASASNTYSNLADVAAGSYLRSGGVNTAPLWSTVTLPNSAVVGDLLSVSATNVYANITAVATGQVLISAGAATLPAWSNTVTLTGNVNGLFTPLSLTNSNAGSSAYTIINFGNNSGVAQVYLAMNSSANTNYAGASSFNIFNQAAAPIGIGVGGAIQMKIGNTGLFNFSTKAFIGSISTTPTALLHLAAGTATAATAPLKLTSGTNMTTAEPGAFEFNGTNLFFTRAGTVREGVLVGLVGAAAPATNTVGVIVDYYGSSATRVLTTPNTWISVVGNDGATYKIPGYS